MSPAPVPETVAPLVRAMMVQLGSTTAAFAGVAPIKPVISVVTATSEIPSFFIMTPLIAHLTVYLWGNLSEFAQKVFQIVIG